MNEHPGNDPAAAAIRPEVAADTGAIFAINSTAFESDAEARLVDRLRGAGAATVSLVAEVGGTLVGHILFSPVTIESEHGPVNKVFDALGLAPMAVVPELPKRGIGSALVRAGIEACRQLGTERLIVLGHPDYYPRFGFQPASGFGITCEYDVPDDTFMAMELVPGALDGVSGVAKYHQEFAGL